MGTVYIAMHATHAVAYLELFDVHGAIESPKVVSPYRGIQIYSP